ncbi:PREDICTED: uncharacterized protein LOC106809401 [Priapulus caudatus]|uniref:Uncharacterized protein LOC106809401 n=1 Tax=Priapulus caudatus TaxID=37621 RepID=A0ABM1E6Y3_PRICU|nr:PREDICTED: uncharacterized protein LOC106809401 [Priapulus caudatus]
MEDNIQSETVDDLNLPSDEEYDEEVKSDGDDGEEIRGPSPPPKASTSRSTKRPIETKKKVRSAKLLRKERDEVEIEMMKSLQGSLERATAGPITALDKKEEPDSDLKAFSQLMLYSLKDMNKYTQSIAKHEIQNIIFKAQMGTLGRLQSQEFRGQRQSAYTCSYPPKAQTEGQLYDTTNPPSQMSFVESMNFHNL